MNLKIMVIIILTLGITIGLYVYHDITCIYNKKLIKNDYVYMTYQSEKKRISSRIIKNILNDKRNNWVLSFATYTYPIIVDNDANNLEIKFGGGMIVVNYKTERYGYVQLVSDQTFNNLEKSLLNSLSH